MARVGLRSETGPGKPYCIRPEGSTGTSSFGESAGVVGTGEVLVVVAIGLAVEVEGLRSAPMKIVAAAAPAAADRPATMANVVFDMFGESLVHSDDVLHQEAHSFGFFGGCLHFTQQGAHAPSVLVPHGGYHASCTLEALLCNNKI